MKKMKKKTNPIVIVLVILITCGCTPTAATTAAPPSPPPADTATATATATLTLPPTLTATLRPTFTPTRTPTATPTADLAQMTIQTTEFTSPDGGWSMVVNQALPLNEDGSLYADYAYDEVILDNLNTGASWVVISEWTSAGLGSGRYEPYLWSPGGDYVYITYVAVPDGCSVFDNGSNLIRVDLLTGERTDLLPEVGSWLALSPDETMLAYGFAGGRLMIRDLTAGTEKETKLPYRERYDAGEIVWSPDQTKLMFTVAFGPCKPPWAESTTLVRVDLETLTLVELVVKDARLFVTVAWDEPERVLLRDKDGKDWWLNPQTGEVVKK